MRPCPSGDLLTGTQAWAPSTSWASRARRHVLALTPGRTAGRSGGHHRGRAEVWLPARKGGRPVQGGWAEGPTLRSVWAPVRGTLRGSPGVGVGNSADASASCSGCAGPELEAGRPCHTATCVLST